MKFQSKKLLVIGAGTAQEQGIRRARELGCIVTAIDANPNSPGFICADKHAVIDFSNLEKVVEFASGKDFDGVMTFSCDAALHSVAEIVERFNLPGLNHRMVDSALNKYKLRQNCAKAGIPGPRFLPVNSFDEGLSACREIGFPCVIKPMDSSGSRGVSLLSSEKDFPSAYSLASNYAKSGVMLESFMEGVESSVEGFVLSDGVHIEAFSDKIRTKPPYLLDTDVIFPTAYEGEKLEAMRAMAVSVMECLKLNPTPFHMEMMMTPDGPRLVEVGLRGPGFKVFSHIIPKVSGFDVLAANIAISLGENPQFHSAQVCASVIKFIAGQEGTVKTISGVDDARRIEGVDEIEIYVKPGDRTRALKSGSDRIGHILAYAKNRADAISVANHAASIIQIAYA